MTPVICKLKQFHNYTKSDLFIEKYGMVKLTSNTPDYLCTFRINFMAAHFEPENAQPPVIVYFEF